MRRLHVLKEPWKDAGAGAGACPAGVNGQDMGTSIIIRRRNADWIVVGITRWRGKFREIVFSRPSCPEVELLRLRLLCQDRAASFSSISCDNDGVGFELQMPRCRDSIARMDDCLVGTVSRAWAESVRPLSAF